MDRLRITKPVIERLKAYHLYPGKHNESQSFILSHAYFTADDNLTIVTSEPDDLILLADDCYDSVSGGHLKVPVDVKAGVVTRAIQRAIPVTVIVDVHDHFFANSAFFSKTDDRDDLRTGIQYKNNLSAYLNTEQNLISVSLLISQNEWRARRVVWENGIPRFKPVAVDLIEESFTRFYHQEGHSIEEWQNRQSTIISPKQSATIKTLKLCFVGGGGTGSVAVEAAVRAGFRAIDIIDPDKIELSNLNRFQGATLKDIARFKAEFLVEKINSIFEDGSFRAITSDVFSEQATESLLSSDIIIGCVDNAETRWYLNHLCVQYALPYFDCGNLIQSEPQGIILHSRISIVIPGLTRCGHCSDIVFFPRKVPDSFLDMMTLKIQRMAGYIQNQDIDQPSPSIYPLNLQTVSWLIQELLNWLCGRSVAHSIYYRTDRNLIERLDRLNYSVGPLDDCPICSSLLGTCNENKLPQRGSEICLSNIFPNME
jgi:hypothetical protein